MRRRHLGEQAPITEAVLELQVGFAESVDIAALGDLQDEVRADYPIRKERFHVEAKLDLSSKAVLSPDVRQDGFLFWSADQRQAMHVRLDGFAFSRLKPYTEWESFRDQARVLWNVYRRATGAAMITRIALRYINRLELPRPLKFEEYLSTVPSTGPGFPPSLSGYFMRLVAPHELGTVILTESIDESGVTERVVPVVVDIDIHRAVQVSASDDDACWSALDQLRELKNEVFFGSLTDHAEVLFDSERSN